MPLSPVDRKYILMRAGKTQVGVADELGVDFSLVSHVLAGRRLTSPNARRIMEYVARLAGQQIHDVFPVDQSEPEAA